MEIKRTERGWAGHFICASACGFRRNTLLENAKTGEMAVVSTVGDYRPQSGTGDSSIGHNRWYETMAFGAHKEGAYIEADVSKELGFNEDIYTPPNHKLGTDNDANDMHERVVERVTQWLIKPDAINQQEGGRE